KRLLKKIIVDAEKLIEKKNNNIKDIREKISKILWTPMEHGAHILIAGIVDQKNLISVLQYVIYFAGQIAGRLLLIESQRELHPELKEAVASLCYIAPWYNELPALDKLKSQFSKKYGKKYGTKFMVNATKSEKADLGVNEQ
ncbi:regulator of Vps4 activity in the MVB pathway protein, partial [Trifolium medium]|nr:regulator of Vps4 activity in the MVB pathway protein [Trifolium medium]